VEKRVFFLEAALVFFLEIIRECAFYTFLSIPGH